MKIPVTVSFEYSDLSLIDKEVLKRKAKNRSDLITGIVFGKYPSMNTGNKPVKKKGK